ncbi:MAG: hypothetical protein N2643_04145 [Endomicrobia bacterium]|nr:hypothetical protein [Endomicrobiia bacterium]
MKLNTSKVIANKQISCDTYLLEFEHSTKVYPTQFVMIDTYPYRFLLKPFSVSDFDGKKLKIIFRKISDGTKWMSTLKTGNLIKYIGPFGNKNKLLDLDIKKYDKIFLIAGGSGIASIIFLYKYLINKTKNIFLFYGEKDKKYIINLNIFNIKQKYYATDNGSFGFNGNVIDLAKKHFLINSPKFIFICGPKEMLKYSKQIFNNTNSTKSIKFNLAQKNFFSSNLSTEKFPLNFELTTFAILEEYMCCGVGLCRSCVVKTKNNDIQKYQTVCKDGPLFKLNELEF